VVFWLCFCGFLYCAFTPEGDPDVFVFETVGQFSYSWAVVCENCPFFGLFFCLLPCPVLGVFFCCICDFSFVMTLSWKSLLCDVAFIVFHSVLCLSVVSGNDFILVI
jgi:hypothetical protein